jgi:hypothetical protein
MTSSIARATSRLSCSTFINAPSHRRRRPGLFWHSGLTMVKVVCSDPLVLRHAAATEAVEQAVVEGIARHGDGFVRVVEAGGDEPAVRTHTGAWPS